MSDTQIENDKKTMESMGQKAAKVKEIYQTLRDIFNFLSEDLAKAWSKIPKFWDNRAIAVIGPTASGKDSLIARLQGKPTPLEYINTSTPDAVESYKISYPIITGETISFKVNKTINAGGEEPDRDEYWGDVCKNSDIVFYLLDSMNLRNEQKNTLNRFKRDMRWLAAKMGDRANFKIVVVLNKFDLLLPEGNLDDLEEVRQRDLVPLIQDVEKEARSCLGVKSDYLSAVLPLCTNDDYLFGQLFPHVLQAAAK